MGQENTFNIAKSPVDNTHTQLLPGRGMLCWGLCFLGRAREQGSQHCQSPLQFNLGFAVVALSVGRLRGIVVSIRSEGFSWLRLCYSWYEMIAKHNT